MASMARDSMGTRISSRPSRTSRVPSFRSFVSLGSVLRRRKLQRTGAGILVGCIPGSQTLETVEPVGDFALPEEIFSFQPCSEEIVDSGTGERRIHSHVRLTEEERDNVARFRFACKEQGISIQSEVEPNILRYVAKARGNMNKAVNDMWDTMLWRQEFFRKPLLDTGQLGEALRDGFAYFGGRDKSMRPFLIVRPCVPVKKKWPVEWCITVMAFCMEFALRYLLLPGRAEQVSLVVDLREATVLSAGRDLKQVIQTISRHYVGRVAKAYVVNVPTLFNPIWNVAKGMLSERQVRKVTILRCPSELLSAAHIAPSQLERRYGGSRSNVAHYYPFAFTPGPFDGSSPSSDQSAPLCDCIRAVTDMTMIGQLAVSVDEEGIQNLLQLRWSGEAADVFRECHLEPPPGALAAEKYSAEMMRLTPGSDRRVDGISSIDTFEGARSWATFASSETPHDFPRAIVPSFPMDFSARGGRPPFARGDIGHMPRAEEWHTSRRRAPSFEDPGGMQRSKTRDTVLTPVIDQSEPVAGTDGPEGAPPVSKPHGSGGEKCLCCPRLRGRRVPRDL